jgi:hypothetical protein
VYQRFREIALMMEAVQTSEKLVNSYQSTRRYNPEDNDIEKDAVKASNNKSSL